MLNIKHQKKGFFFKNLQPQNAEISAKKAATLKHQQPTISSNLHH